MAIGDILAGFAQAGHEHQTNLIQMAYKQRDQLAGAYGKLMQDDSYPEEARQQFGQAFQEIMSTDPFKLPKVIKKYQDMTISVSPPKGPAQSQNLSLPPGGVTPLGHSVPEIPAPQPPSEQRPLMSPIPFSEQMQRLSATEKIKDQGALDIAKAKAGEWKRQTDLARDMPDGKRHKFVVETRVNPDTGESERREVDLGDVANFAPRMGDLVTLERAQTDLENGFFDYKDINGNDLDIKKMIEVYGPYAKIRNKGAYYEPASSKLEFKTFNNQVNAIDPYAPQAPTKVMGTAIPPKTSERPMQVPTETGGRGIVTPTATTSVQTGTGAPLPPPAAGVSPGVAPAVTPAVPTAPQVAPKTQAPVPPVGSKGGIKLQNIEGSMNPGEFNRQSKIVTSIKPALNTILGDPENPSFKGLEAFANITDNEDSRARVGNAARLIIHELADTGSGGSGLGAQVFGTGVSVGGGLITALENKLGATAWKASTSGAVIDKAMQNLTPDERMFLDRLIGAYGTVVGLRAVTSGSALQFNTKLMEKELPVPGLSGVVTRRQFYDKLATLVGEPIASTKTFSPKIFTDRDYYLNAVRRFTALGNGETVVKGTGGKPDLVLRNGAWVPLK